MQQRIIVHRSRQSVGWTVFCCMGFARASRAGMVTVPRFFSLNSLLELLALISLTMNMFNGPLLFIGLLSAIIFGTLTINNSGTVGSAFLVSLFFTGGIIFYMFSEDSDRKNRLRHGYKEGDISDEKQALFSKLYGREMTKKEIADKITKVVWFKHTSDFEELAKTSLKLFPDLTIKAKYIKQLKITFWIILCSLLVTNPSLGSFRAYKGVNGSNEDVSRKWNYFLCSIYTYHPYNKKQHNYFGIAGNFFEID